MRDMRTKPHMKRKGVFLAVLGILLAIIFIAILLNLKNIKTVIYLYKDADKKISSINDKTFNSIETTFIYDKDGNIIDKLYKGKDVSYITYKDMPEEVKQAFICVEDKDFFKHGGVSLKSTIRAGYSYIKNNGKINQGGSTITQQLAKNVFLTMEQSMNRKIEEAFISIKLEHLYSKEQILEFYINNINFANGTYGIDSAAHRYFNKSVKELDLSEIAFLAAIPNNPTYYDPVKNYNNTIERRNFILDKMVEQDVITQDQHDKGIKKKIVISPETIEKKNGVTSYIVDNAVEILMKQNGFKFKNVFKNDSEKKQYEDDYNKLYEDTKTEIYRNGYRIYTSIDQNKQKLLQQSVDKQLAGFKENKDGIYAMQGAAVSINNETGLVEAIVGGRTSEKTDYLNRAFQSYRQPGSSIKPLIVYTPAFEKGYYPSSTMTDKYIQDGPTNSGGGYYGDIKIRKAAQMSLNTVAYQLFDKIGPKYGLSYIQKMNFSKLDKRDENLAASLGGLTYGVSPVEMASAYSALSRNGEFIEPSAISKITDSRGNIIYNGKALSYRVYDEDCAYLMTDVLKGVLEKEWGTGYSIRLSNAIAAGKTGTTNESKDAWFCGYTAYYTTVVWVGYDKPRAVNDLYGSTYPGHIWNVYMQEIHKSLPKKDFERPDGIKEVYVDYNNKKVPEDYEGATKELFSMNNMPQENLSIKMETDTVQKTVSELVGRYETASLVTLQDITVAEQLGIQAQDAVDKIKITSIKTELQNRINARKLIVDKKKEELIKSSSIIKPTDKQDNKDTGTIQTKPSPPTPIEPTKPVQDSIKEH